MYNKFLDVNNKNLTHNRSSQHYSKWTKLRIKWTNWLNLVKSMLRQQTLTLQIVQAWVRAFCAAFFCSLALCPCCFFIFACFSAAFACDCTFCWPLAMLTIPAVSTHNRSLDEFKKRRSIAAHIHTYRIWIAIETIPAWTVRQQTMERKFSACYPTIGRSSGCRRQTLTMSRGCKIVARRTVNIKKETGEKSYDSDRPMLRFARTREYV